MDSIQKILRKLWSDPFSGEILGALAGALFLVGFVSFLIEYAASRHWSLGLLLTAASAAFALWIAMLTFHALRSISMVLVFSVMLVLLGAVTCGGVSYILHGQGWASYDAPQRITMEAFRNFYLWTFLDMVPAIEIWKSFPVKPLVEPTDAIAGTPVFIFRIFVLGIVFAIIRRWWQIHSVATPIRCRARSLAPESLWVSREAKGQGWCRRQRSRI